MKRLFIVFMVLGLMMSGQMYAEGKISSGKDVTTSSIQQSTAQLISLITDMIKQTKDFAIKEAPDAIRQLLQYDFIDVTYKPIIGFVMFSLTLIGTIYIYRKQKNLIANNNDYKHEYEWHDGATGMNIVCWIGIISSSIFGIVFLFQVLVCIPTAIQIKTTPTAYLINKYIK